MEQVFASLLAWAEQAIPAALLAVPAFVLPIVFKRVVGRLLARLKPHQPEWLNIILESYLSPVAQILRVALGAAALWVLPLPFETQTWHTLLTMALKVLVTLLLGVGAWRAAPVCRLALRSAENRLDLGTNKTMGRFFENIFRAVVGVVAGIAALDAVGVPVTGLLTGAGVVGIGITLAAQSTLTDLIAGIALVLEHPFGIGDYILLDNFEGTVEDISFRSTRIRTPDKVIISVENSKVAAAYIQNATDRTSRLLQFTIGVVYSTPREKVEQVCADLKALLLADPEVLPNGMTVTLNAFGASSMDILVRCYVTTIDYTAYLNQRDRLNRAIIDLMARDGCEFAFPSTSVYVEKMPQENAE